MRYRASSNVRVLICCWIVASASQNGLAQRSDTAADTAKAVQMLSARDYTGALPLLLQSANRGNAAAKVSLGDVYEFGTGVDPSPDRALQWFEEAAASGDTAAFNALGAFYKTGALGTPDLVQARNWYARAHDANDLAGTLDLANFYCDGTGIKKDVVHCGELLDDANRFRTPSDSFLVTLELAPAYFKLGQVYESGDGVDRNEVKAASWYAKASALGNADAAITLGQLYVTARGVPQDLSRARAFLDAVAADALDADESAKLAGVYIAIGKAYERLGPDSTAKAVPVYQRAVNLDKVGPAIALGLRYATGAGVPRSFSRASDLLDSVSHQLETRKLGIAEMPHPPEPFGYQRESAESLNLSKSEFAQYILALRTLGIAARDGVGTQPDHARAIDYFEAARRLGDVRSSIELSLLYSSSGDCGRWPLFSDGALGALFHLSEAPLHASDRKLLGLAYFAAGSCVERVQRTSPGGPQVSRAYKAKAAQVYCQSALDGNTAAMLKIASFYDLGVGVPKNSRLALAWREKAAQTGKHAQPGGSPPLAIACPAARIEAIEPPKIKMPKGSRSYGIGSAMVGTSAGPAGVEGKPAATGFPSTVEERYPNIEAPDTVRATQVFAVQVSLTGEQIAPETKILSGKQDNGKLQIPMPVGMTTINIEVNLSAPGMEFVDGSNIATIELSKDQDSTVAQFHLRAAAGASSGMSSHLFATLWYDHAFLARIERDIAVLPSDRSAVAQRAAAPLQAKPVQASGAAASVSHTGSAAASNSGIVIDPLMAAPDLTIMENRVDDTLHLTFVTRYTTPVEAKLDDIEKLHTLLNQRYAELARRGRSLILIETDTKSQQTGDFAAGFGNELYDKFAPDEFKRLYWQLQAMGIRLHTIQVISDDPALPWELMRPARPDGSDRGDFLGLTAWIARWHLGAEGMARPPQELALKGVVVVAPHYQGQLQLQGAQKEMDALRKAPDFRQVQGNYKDVRSLAADLPQGIVHFAGHGAVVDTAGVAQFAIVLEDGQMDPATWKALPRTPGDVHPFYFFNACEVGQSARYRNGVDGWAPALLDSGASGYLGALWSVSDSTAESFAAHFYGLLYAQMTSSHKASVAELVTLARKQTYEESHDPTALAYVLYADPYLSMSR